ncbi:MAG: sigma-54-dependent Fis family transcriptional regulator [Planctomycetota bacterium]|nr:MAG: sigma-54-dependent Fis family transcriptional regulator [Planctomycetota bacterium]
MRSVVDLSPLMRTLLSASAQHAQVKSFLGEVLPEARSLLGAGALALARSCPPRWVVEQASGASEREVPASLAAEAIDRDGPATSGDWLAAPLGDGCALLGRQLADQAAFLEFVRAFECAFRTVVEREQRQQRLQRLETILQITADWRQTDSMESLLKAMAEAATRLFQADRASIFLWDRARKELVARPALGVKGNELRIPDDTGVVGQVVHSRQPRRAGGGVADEQIDRLVDRATGYTTRTLLCVPLVDPGGRCLGAFELLNKRGGQFSAGDERGLAELASHAAIALQNTQAFEELLNKHQQLVQQAAQGLQLIGQHPAIEAIRSTIRRIADTDLAILILGDNGTGKEVVARSIHYLSRRRDQPFIAVNCAALAETLLESELFGHERGAFTDAREARPGKFELASGGTLFLDEIGDMSLNGQAKLLRVLEEKIVVRVGGSTPIHTEVRILAATNHDLAAMVRARKFREDLFFRLNVVSLELPPLRERGDDVLLLAEHFLSAFCRNMGRRPPRFSTAARKRLLAHSWPGNVRELRNLTERLAYLTAGDVVEADELALVDSAASDVERLAELNGTLADATREFQQHYIRKTIAAMRGNMSGAAKRLGLHRSNLYRKMRQLGMAASDDGDELDDDHSDEL